MQLAQKAKGLLKTAPKKLAIEVLSKPRFLRPLFYRYVVKSLANTTVWASFLPRIGIKIVCKKFSEPETDEILSRFWCGGRRQAVAFQERQAERCRNFVVSGGFG